uniref:Uncharacterized protein n=1 Tax=Rhizophora mucronata TaxID=61149 RepID=A0A2P2NGI8_RHIMU
MPLLGSQTYQSQMFLFMTGKNQGLLRHRQHMSALLLQIFPFSSLCKE